MKARPSYFANLVFTRTTTSISIFTRDLNLIFQVVRQQISHGSSNLEIIYTRVSSCLLGICLRDFKLMRKGKLV